MLHCACLRDPDISPAGQFPPFTVLHGILTTPPFHYHHPPIYNIKRPTGLAVAVRRRSLNLEFTTRHSRFGINTAVIPAPIENFFLFQRSFIY